MQALGVLPGQSREVQQHVLHHAVVMMGLLPLARRSGRHDGTLTHTNPRIVASDTILNATPSEDGHRSMQLWRAVLRLLPLAHRRRHDGASSDPKRCIGVIITIVHATSSEDGHRSMHLQRVVPQLLHRASHLCRHKRLSHPSLSGEPRLPSQWKYSRSAGMSSRKSSRRRTRQRNS